jgi:DNA repair protein RecN (Recombination protein N)
MLSRLLIRNYALIDTLDIAFGEGLNIITGETGAGKSVVLGALSLLLGQRAEGRFFYNPDKKCVIEGSFHIEAYGLSSFFETHDLDDEPVCVLRRELTFDGKSRAFINDTPVNLQTLRSLGEQLIHIHSQHATLQLNTPLFQMKVLDSVAANRQVLSEYTRVYLTVKQLRQNLVQLREQIEAERQTASYHQFVFDELAGAQLVSGEQELLEAERDQLEHAEEIKRHLLQSQFLLEEGEVQAIQLIKEALQQVQQALRYSPGLDELAQRLQSCLIELKDVAAEISNVEQSIQWDQARLEEIHHRLTILYGLQQKHRVDSVQALLDLQNTFEAKLQATTQDEAQLLVLEEELAKQETTLQALAGELSKNRSSAIPVLTDELHAQLTQMGIPDAQLHIELHSGDLDQCGPLGWDEIHFLFSANKGQAPQRLSKVASGGELSRLMLGINELLARRNALPTILFDEIDTGISGEVALRVGKVLDQLAQHMQVFAITHLPQIASRGTTHYKVYKSDEGEKTTTYMVPLSAEQRVQEVAEMLSGSNPGASALQHAKELLSIEN